MTPVNVKNLRLGGGVPKICVPLTAAETPELVQATQKAVQAGADLVEWRLDFFSDVFDYRQIQKTADQIREQLAGKPLLLTLRTKAEGGQQAISEAVYFSTLAFILEQQLSELIDVELAHDIQRVKKVLHKARQTKCKIIMSKHDFQKTATNEELKAILFQMADLGADLAKIAVMPQQTADVLRLLELTNQVQSQLTIPLIVISMGGLGKISRIVGQTIGSCLTFATTDQRSAPGQLEIRQLKAILQALEP